MVKVQDGVVEVAIVQDGIGKLVKVQDGVVKVAIVQDGIGKVALIQDGYMSKGWVGTVATALDI